jgi:hypothetical protein
MGCLKEWAAEPARLSAARVGDQWVRGEFLRPSRSAERRDLHRKELSAQSSTSSTLTLLMIGPTTS